MLARAFWPKAQLSLRAVGWAIVYLSVAAGTVLLLALNTWPPTWLAAVPLLRWGLLIVWVWLLICSTIFDRGDGLPVIAVHTIMLLAAIMTGFVLLAWLPRVVVFGVGLRLPIAVGHVATVTAIELVAERLAPKQRLGVLFPLLVTTSLTTAWILSGEWGMPALVMALALIGISAVVARDCEALSLGERGPSDAVMLDGARQCIWAVSAILCAMLLVPSSWG